MISEAITIAHILLVDDEDDCNFVTKLVLKPGHSSPGRVYGAIAKR